MQDCNLKKETLIDGADVILVPKSPTLMIVSSGINLNSAYYAAAARTIQPSMNEDLAGSSMFAFSSTSASQSSGRKEKGGKRKATGSKELGGSIDLFGQEVIDTIRFGGGNILIPCESAGMTCVV